MRAPRAGTTSHYWATVQNLAEIREAARRCADRTNRPQEIHLHASGEPCDDADHEAVLPRGRAATVYIADPQTAAARIAPGGYPPQ